MTSASKKAAKKKAQKSWGLKVDDAIPLVLVRDINEDLSQLLGGIVDGVSSVGVQLIIEQPELDSLWSTWRELSERSDGWIRVLSSEECKERVADIEVFEEVTVDVLTMLKEERVVPISAAGVKAFDPVNERGNGFTYVSSDPWSLFAALVRASETYKFPYDWGVVLKG
jgi:hypothetical protein